MLSPEPSGIALAASDSPTVPDAKCRQVIRSICVCRRSRYADSGAASVRWHTYEMNCSRDEVVRSDRRPRRIAGSVGQRTDDLPACAEAQGFPRSKLILRRLTMAADSKRDTPTVDFNPFCDL